VFAVADHPWRDVETDAAVRIAMSVGERVADRGRLLTVADATRIGSEQLEEEIGFIGLS
jgi:hypothetical protein